MQAHVLLVVLAMIQWCLDALGECQNTKTKLLLGHIKMFFFISAPLISADT